jgi:hypothetical protein
MPSHSDHDRPSLCRNPLTRSPWAWPLLLLIASPLTRGLAVGGTLMFGTGCSEPTYDDCEQWQTDCLEVCMPDDAGCPLACESDHDVCIEEADAAKERHEDRVDAIGEASEACLAVAVCTLETLGDGDGHSDDDELPVPEPDDSDDWGEDWGEQSPGEELEITQTQWTDLPEED